MKGGYSRPLDFEERKEIERLIKTGLSCGVIAHKINRSKNAVVTEVRRSGGRDYCAKKGQQTSDEIKNRRYLELSNRNKGNTRQYYMKSRIESLEMQMEILHDAVKELLER